MKIIMHPKKQHNYIHKKNRIIAWLFHHYVEFSVCVLFLFQMITSDILIVAQKIFTLLNSSGAVFQECKTQSENFQNGVPVFS